jgi:hypothetical protein
MKSPVPFLKPKSYYASPIKSSVTKDEIVVQVNPTPPPVIDDVIVPKPVIEDEQIPLIEQPKLKKSKHNKSSEPEL